MYNAAVAAARRPAWYIEGGVPDTVDGRFDMIAAMLSLQLLRLEAEGDRYAAENAQLAELFVEDMDGQLRESGIGDVVVGKHIGRMMAALGGRLGAYRDALTGDNSLEEALTRNLYRGEAPDPAALAWTAAQIRALHAAIGATPVHMLMEGLWPEQ